MKKNRVGIRLFIFSLLVINLLNLFSIATSPVFKVQIQGGEVSRISYDCEENYSDTEAAPFDDNSEELIYCELKPHGYALSVGYVLDSVDEIRTYSLIELPLRIYKDKNLEEPYKIKRIHL